MAENVTLNGYINQTTGRLDPKAPAPGKTIIITGTGFGTGPNVILFDQFIGADRAAALRNPNVGSWSNNSTYSVGAAKLYYDSQTDRTWLACRDPDNLSSNTRNQNSLFKYTGNVTKFRYVHRAWVPEGFHYPGATSPGVMPVSSSWKQTWWGISNAGRSDLIGTDTPDRNNCIPTHTGNGIISIGGNNNSPRWWDTTTSSAKDFYYPPNSFTAPTLYSYYQDGAGTYNVFDRTISILGVNDNSFSHITRNNCDPFNGNDASFNTRYYDGVRITGWFIDNSAAANVLPLLNDVYIAVGDYSRAILWVSDSPVFSDHPTANLHPLYAPTWTNTEIRTRLEDHNDFGENTHFHIELDDGTILQNVAFTRV